MGAGGIQGIMKEMRGKEQNLYKTIGVLLIWLLVFGLVSLVTPTVEADELLDIAKQLEDLTRARELSIAGRGDGLLRGYELDRPVPRHRGKGRVLGRSEERHPLDRSGGLAVADCNALPGEPLQYASK